MKLRPAKHKRFLILVGFLQKHLHSILLAFNNLNDFVEVFFFVLFVVLNLALNDFVIWRVDVFIQRRLDSFDTKGREKSVVDALLSEYV